VTVDSDDVHFVECNVGGTFDTSATADRACITNSTLTGAVTLAGAGIHVSNCVFATACSITSFMLGALFSNNVWLSTLTIDGDDGQYTNSKVVGNVTLTADHVKMSGLECDAGFRVGSPSVGCMVTNVTAATFTTLDDAAADAIQDFTWVNGRVTSDSSPIINTVTFTNCTWEHIDFSALASAIDFTPQASTNCTFRNCEIGDDVTLDAANIGFTFEGCRIAGTFTTGNNTTVSHCPLISTLAFGTGTVGGIYTGNRISNACTNTTQNNALFQGNKFDGNFTNGGGTAEDNVLVANIVQGNLVNAATQAVMSANLYHGSLTAGGATVNGDNLDGT
jgi:hypothetical protein